MLTGSSVYHAAASPCRCCRNRIRQIWFFSSFIGLSALYDVLYVNSMSLRYSSRLLDRLRSILKGVMDRRGGMLFDGRSTFGCLEPTGIDVASSCPSSVTAGSSIAGGLTRSGIAGLDTPLLSSSSDDSRVQRTLEPCRWCSWLLGRFGGRVGRF